jgi:outer membrane protein
MRLSYWSSCVLLAAIASPAWSQNDSLSLNDAISMARKNNGTIRSAMLDHEASKSRVASSFSSFLPSVTPSYRYDSSRTSTTSGITTVNDGFPTVSASWQLIDSGQRDLSYRASKRFAAQAGSNALQTIRQILFSVHEQYLNTLRAQELVRVSEASVERAEEILKATEAQIAAKQVAEKDRLQAQADRLNAKVDFLGAKNQLSGATASLKASIGWETLRPLPALDKMLDAGSLESLGDLAEMIKSGIAAREDLRSRRFGIEAQRLSVSRAQKDAGISFSVDANYTRNWSDTELDSRSVTFLTSIPLFDGNARREAVRQEELGLRSDISAYDQAVRVASAEIESAYLELAQNRERIEAATAALEASRLNYKAASEAQKLGAEGTSVITVLTAKISLVTAESNYVDALYDVRISEVQLKLVTGQAIPGE